MAHRSITIIVCILAASMSGAAAAPAESDNSLKVPGVCTIGAPGKEWVWKTASAYDEKKGGLYVCIAPGEAGRVVLTIDPVKLTTDAERIAALKAHFNAMHQSLEKLGCTEIKGKRPELTPPIPEDVDYLLFGKLPKGGTLYFHMHTVFHEHTFLIQAAAPSLGEAQKLADVAKTLM